MTGGNGTAEQRANEIADALIESITAAWRSYREKELRKPGNDVPAAIFTAGYLAAVTVIAEKLESGR
jgi:hypothetical protein